MSSDGNRYTDSRPNMIVNAASNTRYVDLIVHDGGIDGDRSVWDQVESAELQSIQADPESLSVAYTVQYETDSSGPGSGESTDSVNLTLSFEDGVRLFEAKGTGRPLVRLAQWRSRSARPSRISGARA